MYAYRAREHLIMIYLTPRRLGRSADSYDVIAFASQLRADISAIIRQKRGGVCSVDRRTTVIWHSVRLVIREADGIDQIPSGIAEEIEAQFERTLRSQNWRKIADLSRRAWAVTEKL